MSLIQYFTCYFSRVELKSVSGTLLVRGVLMMLNFVSKVSLFLTLVSYVYFHNILTAKQVFVITSYMNNLYDSMLHTWPLALTMFAELHVNIKRIETFLLTSESKKPMSNMYDIESETLLKISNAENGRAEKSQVTNGHHLNLRYCHNSDPVTSQKEIILKNVTAYWNNKSKETGADFCLNHFTVSVLCL